MCQCPISGALHFYRGVTRCTPAAEKGVNALSRAHFISTMPATRKCLNMWRVSMPYLGRTSFLRGRQIIKTHNNMCQCPISGALHFYIDINVYLFLLKGVNALSRAHFISTEPQIFQQGYMLRVSMPYLGRTSFLRLNDSL